MKGTSFVYIRARDLKPGDTICYKGITSTKITEIFPIGIKDVIMIMFEGNTSHGHLTTLSEKFCIITQVNYP